MLLTERHVCWTDMAMKRTDSLSLHDALVDHRHGLLHQDGNTLAQKRRLLDLPLGLRRHSWWCNLHAAHDHQQQYARQAGAQQASTATCTVQWYVARLW